MRDRIVWLPLELIVRLLDRVGPEEVEEGMGQEFLGIGPGFGGEGRAGPAFRIKGPEVQAVGSVDDRAAGGAQEGGGGAGADDGVIDSEGFIPAGGPENSRHR